MKKILFPALVFLLLAALLACTSCGGVGPEKQTRAFTPLEKGEVLCVGGNKRFTNSQESLTEEVTLTVTDKATYTLVRSLYAYAEDCVSYSGYYYYWTTSEQTSDKILGEKTTSTYTVYSYLPYGEDLGVAVRAEKTVKTEVSYTGGWEEYPVDVDVKFSGYFLSMEDMREKCPALAEQIDASSVRQYYVRDVFPKEVTAHEEYYENYYYIENVD